MKLHLVKWSNVCLDKRNGGLGVRNLLLLDRTLMCNGVGVLLRRGGLFGGRPLAENTRRSQEGSALVK